MGILESKTASAPADQSMPLAAAQTAKQGKAEAERLLSSLDAMLESTLSKAAGTLKKEPVALQSAKTLEQIKSACEYLERMDLPGYKECIIAGAGYGSIVEFVQVLAQFASEITRDQKLSAEQKQSSLQLVQSARENAQEYIGALMTALANDLESDIVAQVRADDLPTIVQKLYAQLRKQPLSDIFKTAVDASRQQYQRNRTALLNAVQQYQK